MTRAPQIGDRILVSRHTEPPLHGLVERVVGFQERNDTNEWVVALGMAPRYPGSSNYDDEGGRRIEAHVVERHPILSNDAKWEVVDPNRPQPTR